MNTPSKRTVANAVGGLILLALRNVFLWIAVPLAMIVWLAIAPWMLRHKTGIGTFIGWVDLNLIALLERSLLRPFFAAPAAWVPVRQMASVRHRVMVDDLL